MVDHVEPQLPPTFGCAIHDVRSARPAGDRDCYFAHATLLAQTTISTGSIQGTVTDPSGAAVSGAKITITQKSTGRVISTTTTSSGTYASGALTPGDYVVHVDAPGFKTTEETVTVEVGVTSTGNLKLQLGQASQIVEVQATEYK